MRAINDPQAFAMVFERYHLDIHFYCLRRLGHPNRYSSIGGLWGFMPATGDPLLMGLVPWTDLVLYPVPE